LQELRGKKSSEERMKEISAAIRPASDVRRDLLTMTSDTDPEARIAAIEALGIMDSVVYVDMLRMLTDNDVSVRKEAVGYTCHLYGRQPRGVAQHLWISTCWEKDPLVLRAKAEALDYVTWGRFGYHESWTDHELRDRLKGFGKEIDRELQQYRPTFPGVSP
jgi:HEAT repeat protein